MTPGRNLAGRVVGERLAVELEADADRCDRPRVRESVRLIDAHGRVVVDGLSRWLVELVARGRDNT